ncbi:MAG TPA: DNA internalization-related competence protein ComEC/Rec2 [Thermoanaerobaculia bacterium]
MYDDVPAALPLLALSIGLASGANFPEALAFAAIAVLLAFLRQRRAAASTLFLPLGILLALHVQTRTARETAAFATFDATRFVTIEAPLERDWAARSGAFVLRASRFRAGDLEFDAPLAAYARFEPPPMELAATLRAEGFLRRNENGVYSITIKSPRLMSYEGALDRRTPRAWNRMLANRLRPFAREHPAEVALTEALVLGRGERLTDEIRESFRRGGTYHLLVFSGLQIALAAGAIAMLLRWLHKPRASDWLLLTFALLAPLFIGATASVSRASLGIGLFAVSRILKRPTPVENLWCLAALLRLIVEPRDLTDASFHLTYAGAGALLFIGKPWTRGRVVPHLVAAEVAVAPLTLFHFRQYALGGSILTLILSPFLFAMLIVSAFACAFPSRWLFRAIALLHRLCAQVNELGSFASGVYARPPLAAMIAGFALAAVAIALLRGRRRALAAALALTIPSCAAVLHSRAQRTVDRPQALFLDVSQGDAIALRDRQHVVLVDGGMSAGRLLPMLVDRGVHAVDLMVLTHAHPDHCGALPPVVEWLEVRELWISTRRLHGDCVSKLVRAAADHGTRIHHVRDGDTRTFGTLELRAHIPDRTFKRAKENNASIVLHARAGGRSILLTGDAEREAELWLADRDLRADVLKVAHHGSRSSTTRLFLDAVRPRVAVISCGRENQFGHPHESVLETLAARRIRVWRTDRGGTVTIELKDGQVRVFPQFDTPRAAP